MTCREFADFMADYLAGELPLPQREAFDRHLAACVNCTRYLDGYRRSSAMSRAALEDADADVPVDVPEDLIQAILRARNTSQSQ